MRLLLTLALSPVFETPWSRLLPALTDYSQAWLLVMAAFSLRSLGRLHEAIEPMRAGLKMRIQQENWKNAAISAGNLSELKLTLGAITEAIGDAEFSVTYADRSRDATEQMFNRTTHADALHQAGKRIEAEALFHKAEAMQAENQSEYPLLYSLQGFRYCDLLLAVPERIAWQRTLNSQSIPYPLSSRSIAGSSHSEQLGRSNGSLRKIGF